MTTQWASDVDDLGEEFVPNPEYLKPREPTEEDAEDIGENYDEPDASIGQKRPRSPRARQYQKKASDLFSTVFRVTASHPSTVADSAAIMMHGPELAEKVGDLAAHDKRFARAIDMITEGSENPYMNLIAAAAPLVIQVMRNHEQAEPQAVLREWRIPFTKKSFKLRFRFKLTMPTPIRNMTNDPDALTAHVFSNEDVAAMIQREGIHVARRTR